MANGLVGLGVVLLSSDKLHLRTSLTNYAKENGWCLVSSSAWGGQEGCIILGKLEKEMIGRIWELKKKKVIWVLDPKGFNLVKNENVEIARWIVDHMWDDNPEGRAIAV